VCAHALFQLRRETWRALNKTNPSTGLQVNRVGGSAIQDAHARDCGHADFPF
jgi:hypothetical protein